MKTDFDIEAAEKEISSLTDEIDRITIRRDALRAIINGIKQVQHATLDLEDPEFALRKRRTQLWIAK